MFTSYRIKYNYFIAKKSKIHINILFFEALIYYFQ